MSKDEILSVVEGLRKYPYYKNNFKLGLINECISNLEDYEISYNLTPCLVEKIIELLVDCYDMQSLVEWLEKNNYNPFNNFDYAEIYYKDDLSEEDWEEMKEDCLFFDEEEQIIVYSW